MKFYSYLIVRARSECSNFGLLIQRNPDDVPRRPRVTGDGQELLGALNASPAQCFNVFKEEGY